MTGIELFIDSAAGGLTGIVFDIAKKAGGSLLQVIADKKPSSKTSKQYAEKYQNRYGSLKRLEMQPNILLKSVSTAQQWDF